LVQYRDLIEQRLQEQDRQGSLFETLPAVPQTSQEVGP
jgi:hypothetical protein